MSEEIEKRKESLIAINSNLEDLLNNTMLLFKGTQNKKGIAVYMEETYPILCKFAEELDKMQALNDIEKRISGAFTNEIKRIETVSKRLIDSKMEGSVKALSKEVTSLKIELERTKKQNESLKRELFDFDYNNKLKRFLKASFWATVPVGFFVLGVFLFPVLPQALLHFIAELWGV